MRKFLLLAVFLVACNPVHVRDFNVKYSFGVESGRAQNVLDTFHDTFTKDMILSSSITTEMILSEEEMQSIKDKLDTLDIWTEPAPSTTVSVSAPCDVYSLTIQEGEDVKTATWDCSSTTKSADRAEFNEFMWTLIQGQEEFQALPEPEGGYM